MRSLVDGSSLHGKYSSRLCPADFCEKVPNIGVIFSIEVDKDLYVETYVQAKLSLVSRALNSIPKLVEGKFEKQTVSLTGKKIPYRLFLLISEDLDPKQIRRSHIELLEISPMKEPGALAGFKVKY